MVGTRSIASQISAERSGTRWNASLPSFSLAYFRPVVADEIYYRRGGMEEHSIQGIVEQFAHSKRGHEICGDIEGQMGRQQEPERLNASKAKSFPRNYCGEEQQQPNSSPVIEFHKLRPKSAQYDAKIG